MDAPHWQPLSLLRQQFEANLQALNANDGQLASRLAGMEPKSSYHVATGEHSIELGVKTAEGISPLPNPISPAAAKEIAGRLFPAGHCSESVLIAGLDQGWLWNSLYQLDVNTPRTPGHRPPLYFLAGDLERLWVVMHLHDWGKLLSDARVRIFAGDDCVRQTQAAMVENPLVPWPKFSVTVDPGVWAAESSIDTLITQAAHSASSRLNQLMRQVNVFDATFDPRAFAQRCTNGPLRILGITSRYTTFLQYSMRDWLAAFAQLGHQTRLLIEQSDEQIANPLHFAEVCGDFRPDMIVMIDHYRSEFGGLPQNVPCVMWVQDRLPNIFRSAAGVGQKPADYVLGYGWQECVFTHGYPRQRFMPAMVGFNADRFAERLSDDDLAPFLCDVSFVSHASTPPEVLVQREIDKTSLPEAKKFLGDMLDRLRAIYEVGDFVTEAGHIRRIVRETMLARGVQSDDIGALVDFFAQKVNNALFRQQAIEWLAEMDINLHLYGRGWDEHPRLAKYARGIADNQSQLAAIYQASGINLQVTPFGAVHQRLLDGLAAGGFVLLRHCTGDECDRIYQQMWKWCEEADIRSGQQLFRQAPPPIRSKIAEIVELTGEDPSRVADQFFAGLEEAASAGFTRSAATLFDEYDRISFRSKDQLQGLVTRYLSAPQERQTIAESMRARVMQCMTYNGITRRLLDFIATDLVGQTALRAAA